MANETNLPARLAFPPGRGVDDPLHVPHSQTQYFPVDICQKLLLQQTEGPGQSQMRCIVGSQSELVFGRQTRRPLDMLKEAWQEATIFQD